MNRISLIALIAISGASLSCYCVKLRAQAPFFSRATIHVCRAVTSRAQLTNSRIPSGVTDFLGIDTPGVSIDAREHCVLQQLFLQLPNQRRSRGTTVVYGSGYVLADDPDYFVSLWDTGAVFMGVLIVNSSHETAGFFNATGAYQTLYVQPAQIELFLQLMAIHGLDR